VSLQKRLEMIGPPRGGRKGGPVEVVITDAALGAEVEIALPGQWPITPEMRGAIKAASGVLHVEEV
jgi:DNA polymerase-3 subunit alpha